MESHNFYGSESQANILVPRAYFHAKARRLVLIRIPVEDRMGVDAGKIGLMKKSMCGTRDAASNWERDSQEYVKSWSFQLGVSWKNLFRHEGHLVSGMAHGDDFVVTGAGRSACATREHSCRIVPNHNKFHFLRIKRTHQSIEPKVVLRIARNCV